MEILQGFRAGACLFVKCSGTLSQVFAPMPAPQYVDKKGRIIETLPFYIISDYYCLFIHFNPALRRSSTIRSATGCVKGSILA